MRKAIRLALAGLLTTVNLALVSPVHAVGTTYVNASDPTSDVGGCGSSANPCNTIQAGVDANTGGFGSKIQVAAGNYPEIVTVNKTLKIVGPKENQNPWMRTGPEATVMGLVLAANNIEVNGMRIAGNAGGPGIQTSPSFSGYNILYNIIEDNVFGVYFHSSGTTISKLSWNLIRNNNRPGAASGNGVYSDQGLHYADIDQNRFTGAHANASITLVGPSQTRVNIKQNTFTGDLTGLYIINTSNSKIENNTFSNFAGGGHGIQLDGNNNGLMVGFNTITSPPWSGIRIKSTYGTNTNLQLYNNTVTGAGDAGISVDVNGMTGGVIKSNQLRNNGNSMAEDGTFDDGLLLQAGSTGIRIEYNVLSGNIGHDIHNNSGTNTFVGNSCRTSQPAGLCI